MSSLWCHPSCVSLPPILQPQPLRMAHPSSPQGWGVVAGGIRGVWQGVPHPQQLCGQDQAQVNAEKDLSQGGPWGTWLHHRTWPTLRPDSGHCSGTSCPEQCWGLGRWHGMLECPQDMPQLGQDGPRGAGCPWQPGEALPVPTVRTGGCMRASAGRRRRSCCSVQATTVDPF